MLDELPISPHPQQYRSAEGGIGGVEISPLLTWPQTPGHEVGDRIRKAFGRVVITIYPPGWAQSYGRMSCGVYNPARNDQQCFGGIGGMKLKCIEHLHLSAAGGVLMGG